MSGPPQSTTFPDSTAISRAAYHPDRRALDVWYRGGDRYTYFDVPLHVYYGLCAAPSAGEFINRVLKPAYAFEIEPGRRRYRPSNDE